MNKSFKTLFTLFLGILFFIPTFTANSAAKTKSLTYVICGVWLVKTTSDRAEKKMTNCGLKLIIIQKDLMPELYEAIKKISKIQKTILWDEQGHFWFFNE